MSDIKICGLNTVHTIFIDRDGVINQKLEGDNPYVTDWKKFRFLPGALKGIRMLNEVSKRIIVVTNQRGIALDLMTESDLINIHRKMQDEIVSYGGRLDGIYHCPHDLGQCHCRKPSSGLFEKARNDFPDIDYSTSIVVGDSAVDLQAACTIRAKPVLISTRSAWPDSFAQCSSTQREEPLVYPSLQSFAEAIQNG